MLAGEQPELCAAERRAAFRPLRERVHVRAAPPHAVHARMDVKPFGASDVGTDQS